MIHPTQVSKLEPTRLIYRLDLTGEVTSAGRIVSAGEDGAFVFTPDMQRGVAPAFWLRDALEWQDVYDSEYTVKTAAGGLRLLAHNAKALKGPDDPPAPTPLDPSLEDQIWHGLYVLKPMTCYDKPDFSGVTLYRSTLDVPAVRIKRMIGYFAVPDDPLMMPIRLDDTFLSRHNPRAGDYLLWADDQLEHMRREKFERQYSVPERPL